MRDQYEVFCPWYYTLYHEITLCGSMSCRVMESHAVNYYDRSKWNNQLFNFSNSVLFLPLSYCRSIKKVWRKEETNSLFKYIHNNYGRILYPVCFYFFAFLLTNRLSKPSREILKYWIQLRLYAWYDGCEGSIFLCTIVRVFEDCFFEVFDKLSCVRFL